MRLNNLTNFFENIIGKKNQIITITVMLSRLPFQMIVIVLNFGGEGIDFLD